VRALLDVNILVRANEKSVGLARELLRELLRQGWTILVSGEMLVETARVLRYPRLQARYNLSETDIYEYIQFLRKAAEFVVPDVSLAVPIRDPADIVVVQTAITGEAEVLCTVDEDFYEPAIVRFLDLIGIRVMNDIALMRILRTAAGGTDPSTLRTC
jgi:putative PIN family toxin of toxin-antitoxin system